MSKKEDTPAVVPEPEVDDDEPDDWDKRIFSTGCAEEQDKMNDCYFTKKDWRQCKDEGVQHPTAPTQLLDIHILQMVVLTMDTDMDMDMAIGS
ncbi:uncharacterized protein ACLA_081350 [Aspergillus clavatus NRRL 1]|uniref:Uncharacterized protein n=1 Tax=Aspergillus clavatus (strain ATCC 1007 / CBS 513.65 / DSM 816 / NCTC 3887 / NRRL 1 / QM 1276 / 107) TaxID=344612 RepID=A1CT10_ASPCL|nr:uncharacterized protein ACLA_081350 [Aspergillus clavatus NRRL 1]EAW06447.1 hypothetical protein ACLA_081350 [Aspergillus clavatus NRRL 1]